MKSMTGFGTAQVEGVQGTILVEMRSYNHRFLDLRLRLHRELLFLEPHIHAWARRHLTRGRVEIRVQWEDLMRDELPLRFRPEVLRFYLNLQEGLRDMFGLSGSLDVCTALRLKEVVSQVEEHPPADVETAWAALEPALEEALKALEKMQEREGRILRDDLLARIRTMDHELERVADVARGLPETYRRKLEERVAQLLAPESYDPQRIAQEIVLHVDRIDITEEIVRLRSHLDLCSTSMHAGALEGKRLDFLAQEILREVNTIGSKNTHPDIVYGVVNMKTEIEKIREQAQNLL